MKRLLIKTLWIMTDRADLENMAQFSKLAQAALIILDAQKENENASS